MDEIRSELVSEPSGYVQPLAEGKFALFETPSGGMHLTLRLNTEEEARHIEIPKMMLKMLNGKVAAMLGGKPHGME